MPRRICLAPRCLSSPHHRGYCQRHARAKEQCTNRAGKRIYNTARWKNTRKAYLYHHPLCRCGEIATDVHHRKDLADGGDPWDFTNLEALCHSCHSQETRRRQVTSGVGWPD